VRHIVLVILLACGPTKGSGDVDPSAPCTPGETVACYEGQDGTKGVGPCKGGTRTCTAAGMWGGCDGEVVPVGEACGDGADNNCNGMVDEDQDADGDGITTCGGDCCDSTECSAPKLVNPGAFDAPGNNFDDDCDGTIDNGAAACDSALVSDTTSAVDFAKAIELCEQTTMADKKWGVISAQLTLANGSGVPAVQAHAVRPKFGATTPRAGQRLALLSTGAAAGKTDTRPAYQDVQHTPALGGNGTQSAFPADFLAANGNTLPNAPGCPAPGGSIANDPIMLTLTIRVPTNARSFTLDTSFFSSEFPEYTCSPFNDFFVVLLDSAYAGSPANPSDKNLAFYTPPGGTQRYPVGVNLAANNTGLFTQCKNGHISCRQVPLGPTVSTCTSTADLAGTGFDTPDPGWCDDGSLQGGGTGWLRTSGNVNPGEIIKLRIAIWDTSDHLLDSIAAIDAFQWSVELAQPGTILF
jgi:Putative metal-binding motif